MPGMGDARRELLGPYRLVLDVADRPGPPGLRFEATEDGRRRVIRQGERPLLLGALTGDGCCHDLHLHRLDGYRSPLPPVESARMRSAVNWVHQYARWLERADGSPLYDGRWELSARTAFPLPVWTCDLVRDWPGGLLELYCGGGWHGVLPLRRLSAPGAARVKAYRKHAREGTLAPVLLWWVPFLDGWVILDGHDRAVAALAEGGTPECVVLTRLRDEELWRREAEAVADGDVLAELPYEPSGVRTWPLTGGVPAWDALAAVAVFQFPRD
jgi:hypothetical protein